MKEIWRVNGRPPRSRMRHRIRSRSAASPSDRGPARSRARCRLHRPPEASARAGRVRDLHVGPEVPGALVAIDPVHHERVAVEPGAATERKKAHTVDPGRGDALAPEQVVGAGDPGRGVGLRRDGEGVLEQALDPARSSPCGGQIIEATPRHGEIDVEHGRPWNGPWASRSRIASTSWSSGIGPIGPGRRGPAAGRRPAGI